MKAILVHPQPLRYDTDGFSAPSMNIGSWTLIIISAVVLMIVTTALFPTFLDSLTDFDNATTNPLAPVLVTLVPLLLIVALLLIFVFAFLPGRIGGKGK